MSLCKCVPKMYLDHATINVYSTLNYHQVYFCTYPFTLCSAKLAQNGCVFVSFCIYMPVCMRSCICACMQCTHVHVGICVYIYVIHTLGMCSCMRAVYLYMYIPFVYFACIGCVSHYNTC